MGKAVTKLWGDGGSHNSSRWESLCESISPSRVVHFSFVWAFGFRNKAVRIWGGRGGLSSRKIICFLGRRILISLARCVRDPLQRCEQLRACLIFRKTGAGPVDEGIGFRQYRIESAFSARPNALYSRRERSCDSGCSEINVEMRSENAIHNGRISACSRSP